MKRHAEVTTDGGVVYVRLPKEDHEAIKRRAAAERRSIAEVIRGIVRRYLDSSAES